MSSVRLLGDVVPDSPRAGTSRRYDVYEECMSRCGALYFSRGTESACMRLLVRGALPCGGLRSLREYVRLHFDLCVTYYLNNLRHLSVGGLMDGSWRVCYRGSFNTCVCLLVLDYVLGRYCSLSSLPSESVVVQKARADNLSCEHLATDVYCYYRTLTDLSGRQAFQRDRLIRQYVREMVGALHACKFDSHVTCHLNVCKSVVTYLGGYAWCGYFRGKAGVWGASLVRSSVVRSQGDPDSRSVKWYREDGNRRMVNVGGSIGYLVEDEDD